jgi:hypothetical protein
MFVGNGQLVGSVTDHAKIGKIAGLEQEQTKSEIHDTNRRVRIDW